MDRKSPIRKTQPMAPVSDVDFIIKRTTNHQDAESNHQTKDCTHKWEKKELFTTSYFLCTECGKEMDK